MEKYEQDPEKYRQEYFSIPQWDFIKKYNISIQTCYKLFGKKLGNALECKNKYDHKLKVHVENRVSEIAKKFKVQNFQIRELMETYTLSEIERGDVINGKLVPLDYIKCVPTPQFYQV